MNKSKELELRKKLIDLHQQMVQGSNDLLMEIMTLIRAEQDTVEKKALVALKDVVAASARDSTTTSRKLNSLPIYPVRRVTSTTRLSGEAQKPLARKIERVK